MSTDEDDEVGWSSASLPTYALFREYATFNPAIKDFGLNQKQFSALLNKCGLRAPGGMHLGDANIMFKDFNTHGCLNYAQACHIARVMLARSNQLAHLQSTFKQQSEKKVVDAKEAAALDASITFSHLIDPFEHMDAVREAELHETTSMHTTHHHTHTLSPSPFSPRPMSAPPAGQSKAPKKSRAEGARLHWAVLADPPNVVREVLPAPACPYPTVRTFIHGIQVLIDDGDLSRARTAILELLEEWRNCLAAEQARKARSKDYDSSQPKAKLPAEAEVWSHMVVGSTALTDGKWTQADEAFAHADLLASPRTLGEYHPYLYIIPLCQSLLYFYQGQYKKALQTVEDGTHIVLPSTQDPFNVLARRTLAAYCNNRGACLQMLQREMEAVKEFQHSISLFKTCCGPDHAVTLAVMKNLKRVVRTGKVRSMTLSMPSTQMTLQQSATARVQRQVKMSLGTAQPWPLPAWHSPELTDFLRKAIPERVHTVSMPPWATKVNPADVPKGKGKGAAAKKPTDNDKGGKKVKTVKKAKSKFEAMAAPPPRYGVRNLELPAPKKKKAAKAKK